MREPTRLDQITQQPDSVFSTREEPDLHVTGARLYSLLEKQTDLSSGNFSLLDLAGDVGEEYQLSPLRANVLRVFDWKPGSRVLEIGCGGGAVTRFLAEQDLKVDAIEPDRSLARLAALRIREFENVRIICESPAGLDFGNSTYDAVVLVGTAENALMLTGEPDRNVDDVVIELIQSCMNLLDENGRLFLAADNRQGVKYLFGAADERSRKRYYGFHGYRHGESPKAWNLCEWHNLLEKSGADAIEQYSLFPDFRYTRVLLGKNYTDQNRYAYQHLEGVHSRDYYQTTRFDFTETLLHEATVSNRCLGSFVNSFLFVLDKSERSGDRGIDFCHLPDFQRKPEYRAVVKKYTGENRVRRIPLQDPDAQISKDEQYVQGLQLSVQWHRQLLYDPDGIDFGQSLLEYFEYLRRLESGVYAGFNIDALPNNIIVDAHGNYHLFDQEWQTLNDEIDAEFVFYRAMVIFVLKNAAAFSTIKRIHNLASLGDFLVYSFRAVGLDPSVERLEKYKDRDIAFQNRILEQSAGYRLSDPLGSEFAESEIHPCLLWRFKGENYNPGQRVFVSANANNTIQDLKFELPQLEQEIECIRFFPYESTMDADAGYFGVHSLCLSAATAQGGPRTLFRLDSGKEVAKANIHDKVVCAKKDGETVFLFTSNENFLEIELPGYDQNDGESLEVNIEYRVARSHDYELARNEVGSMKREMVDRLKLARHEKKQFEAELHELNLIKNSKAWRLVQAYRDAFRITGYPVKSLYGKLAYLVKQYQRTK